VSTLQVYSIVPQTRVLGPFLRFALWVQGCPFRCQGCITPDSLPVDGGESLSVASVAEAILSTPDIEGITISGGEPFAQAGSLYALLRLVKNHKNLGVIIYSGYTLAKLRKQAKSNSAVDGVLRYTDLLIDGPYVAAKDDGLSLRGSANQQLHLLTARYAEYTENYGKAKREVEIHVREDDVMLVGIAGEETRQRWQSAKIK
jgi:anaerobic ribonucleoside-triphosphate reductase activating protein